MVGAPHSPHRRAQVFELRRRGADHCVVGSEERHQGPPHRAVPDLKLVLHQKGIFDEPDLGVPKAELEEQPVSHRRYLGGEALVLLHETRMGVRARGNLNLPRGTARNGPLQLLLFGVLGDRTGGSGDQPLEDRSAAAQLAHESQSRRATALRADRIDELIHVHEQRGHRLTHQLVRMAVVRQLGRAPGLTARLPRNRDHHPAERRVHTTLHLGP